MIWRSRTRWDAPTKEWEQIMRRQRLVNTLTALALFGAGMAVGLSLTVLL